MGKSVAVRAGETILVRDISNSRPRSSNQASNSRKRKPEEDEDTSAVRNESGQNDSIPTYGTTPDVAVYLNNERTNELLVIKPEVYAKRPENKKRKEDDERFKARQNWVAHRSWSDIVAFFEAKIDPSFSAFEFAHQNTHFVCDDTNDEDKFLDQFLEYLEIGRAHV